MTTRNDLAETLLRTWATSPGSSFFVNRTDRRVDLSRESKVTVSGFRVDGEDLLGVTRNAFRELARHSPLEAAPFLVVAAMCDKGTKP